MTGSPYAVEGKSAEDAAMVFSFDVKKTEFDLYVMEDRKDSVLQRISIKRSVKNIDRQRTIVVKILDVLVLS